MRPGRRAARAYAFDVVVALLGVLAVVEVAVRRDAAEAPRSSLWFTVPAIVVMVSPLFARRRFPFGAPAAYWLLALAVSFLDGRLVPFTTTIFVLGMAAAFLLGNLEDAFRAQVGLVVVVGGAAGIVYNQPGHSPSSLVFIPLLFGVCWLAGYALHERAEQLEAAEARAAQAERARATAARLAVAEERARIARELHDIVAHAVSVMVLQTGAVRHRLPAGLPDDAEALRGVERTGRKALAEMRRLLAAMRTDGDDAELGPQPGLEALAPLLDEIGRAGLPAALHVEGKRVPLPPAIDLSVYRIVQEGLTNALKHAGASRADVTVRFAAQELRVEVRDDGGGDSAGDGLGHGLVGMRERVKIYGGELTAGSADEGGFVLSASLPLDGYEP